ncbi:diguanylate cyclase domain-containing protein [Clostridium sp. YIM B02551]|uniref:sensor domain-containing diguanylate cyclase n=1 Tax=Clostridium sp. YIM B02551 TaxID=2910679 RepID=UPI001EEA8D4B|nr:diguanylate cyclase [Clostridium sp. YIM B02551]
MNNTINRDSIDLLLHEINKIKYVNYEKTLTLANETLGMSEKIGYELGIAISKYFLSEAYYNTGNYENSIDLTYYSLDIFIKEGLYDLQCGCYNQLGIIFSELGEYDRSMDFYSKAEETAALIDSNKKFDENSSTKKSMVRTLNNISEIYKFLQDYNEALNYCNTAYEIDKQFDFSFSKGITLLSLGELYYLLEDYDKSTELSYTALKYFNLYNYKIPESDCYKLLALSYWKKSDFIKAEDYFDIALNINKNHSPVFYKIDVLINYFEYLKERGNFNKALNKLKEACILAIKSNMTEKISETSSLLAMFYGELGDYENSYKYSKMHYENEKENLYAFHNHLANNLKIKKRMDEMIVNNENLKSKSDSLQTIIEKISIISELGQEITSTLNLNKIIDILHSSIKNLIDFTYLGIGLYDEKSSTVNYLDVFDDGKKRKKASLSIAEYESFTSRCITNSEFIIVNDMSSEYLNHMDEETYRFKINKKDQELNSLIFCPLIINTKVIGIMSIQSKEKHAFTAYHIEMIKSLSSYASIAINNAIKSSELEKEIEKTHAVQAQLKELNKKLLFLSENDSMTKIPNRRKLDSYLKDIWNRTLESGNRISLVLFDVDYFKEYNDNYGHVEGDRCIVKIAKILSTFENENFFAARYGGDEFIIVLPECSLNKARELCENLQEIVKFKNIPHAYSKVSDKVTLSLGVTSIVPNKSITIKDFIKKADTALYIAKKRGRNQIAIV